MGKKKKNNKRNNQRKKAKKKNQRNHQHTSSSRGGHDALSAPESDAPQLIGCRGLHNLGNTCYLNSCLQSLASLAILGVPENVPEDLLSAKLHLLLQNLTRGTSRSSLSPAALFNLLQKVEHDFRGRQQQDAHQCLLMLLDTALFEQHVSSCLTSVITCHRCSYCSIKQDPVLDLSIEIPLFHEGDDSSSDSELSEASSDQENSLDDDKADFLLLLNDFFLEEYGDSTQVHFSTRFQDDMCLDELGFLNLAHFLQEKLKDELKTRSLELEGKFQIGGGIETVSDIYNELFSMGSGAMRSNEMVPTIGVRVGAKFDARDTIPSYDSNLTLRRCLDAFTDPELLKGHEKYACQRCGGKTVSSKQVLLDKYDPPIAIFHLKRFARLGNGRTVKISRHVQFEEELELRDICYSLRAVVVHQGGSLRSGHYICYARRQDTWYYISDTQVKKTNVQNVLRSEGYILFYERTR